MASENIKAKLIAFIPKLKHNNWQFFWLVLLFGLPTPLEQ